MKIKILNHIITKTSKLNEALIKINLLNFFNILFLVDENSKLIGSLSDGDIRRGLIKGYDDDTPLIKFANKKVNVIVENHFNINEILKFKRENIKIIPVIDTNNFIVEILNLNVLNSYLPLDSLIMAGGRGTRLSPLTDNIPKPLIKVGDKSILDHNIDRLRSFGINKIISINYLGNKIEEHTIIENLITLINREKNLGTIGVFH